MGGEKGRKQHQHQQQWVGDDGYRREEWGGSREEYGHAVPLREFPGRT